MTRITNGRAILRTGGVLLLLAVAPLATATAQCRALEARACVLTLGETEKASASATCTDEIWQEHLKFESPGPFTDGNRDGWWETVLRINLDAAKGCGCAVLRLHGA